ncbi:MAG TPA: two-component regulator propeller domain-containing protein [Bacteroidota bacterium]|nr:two-component regulator propeller domain-containing protein [Bacteroidota bacterium]
MESIQQYVRNVLRVLSGVLLLLAVCTVPTRSQGRAVDFDRLSLEEGLSESAVSTIVQDHLGFLWFGTQDGLNRYDGHTFVVFRNDPSDSTSLSDNFITSLLVDSKGRLWIGTEDGGLNLLRSDNRSFQRFNSEMEDSADHKKTYITGIVEDRNGCLWIGTLGNGVVRLDPATNSVRRYKQSKTSPGSLSHNSVWTMHVDKSGAIWAGTYDGLNRYNQYRDRFEVFRISGKTSSNINAIAEGPGGVLWCSAWKVGLYIFDQEKDALVPGRVSGAPTSQLDTRVMSLIVDARGTVWAGTVGSGLQHFDGSQLEVFRNEPSDLRSLSANQVLSLLMDRSGDMWIGTNSGGINRLKIANRKFEHLRHTPDDPNSISSNNVWAFYEDREGNLWIGTVGGGLDRIDHSTRRVTYYGGQKSQSKGLTSSAVSCILEDHTGLMWIGTQDAGLFRFNKAQNKFTRFSNNTSDTSSLGADIVNCIYEDSRGTLWIGTYGGGLNRFDRQRERFTRYMNDPRNPHGIGGNSVMTITSARGGGMWIGTFFNGLDRFKDGLFTHYRNDPSNPSSLNNDRIESLLEDSSGALWIGTWGGGLNRLDEATGRVTHFTGSEGLPNPTVYGILPDNRGNLWMSTNKGIAAFNIKSAGFRTFEMKDGLQDNEFNQGAYLRLRSGELLFGGANGYNRFNPDNLGTGTSVPPVVLTSINVNGPGVSFQKDVVNIPKLELRYDQNFFTLEFAALDFANSSRNTYAYMIEGYDKTWVQAGTRHAATYTNVEPGLYTFRVIACNSDGVWNREGAKIELVIHPPLWKTWWAYTLYWLAGLSLVIALVRQRTRVHEERSREQVRKLEEGARQLAHERFISHSLRQAEEKLAISEKRLRQIIDLIPHFIFARDAKGKFILANKAVADAFGTTVDGIVGKDEVDFGISDDASRRSREDDRQIIQSGQPKEIPEELMRDIHGHQRVVHTQKIPFTFSGSSSPSVLGVSVDITERKSAEAARAKSESDFKQLFDNANDVILIFEPETEIILEANAAACRTYGIDRSTLVGMSLKKLTLDVGRGETQIKETLAQGTTTDFESIHLNDKGEQIHFLINSSVIEYHGRQAILSINRDVTERRQAEEALRQGQKLKSIGTLAGGIAHDFNNLLNAVLGQSALALNKLPKESPAGSNITKAIKAAERAADLTRQLLAYSGKGKLLAELVDLNVLVKENVQMLEVSVPKTTHLRFDLGTPSPHIKGDVGQIQQVIMNLIINAGEAIGTNPGYITVRTDRIEVSATDTGFWKYTNTPLPAGEYALLQVGDSGHGMNSETLARIFDPFFTTKFTGRGLGLAAVLGIIRGHHGGVRIISEPGKGSRFDVVFPLADASVEFESSQAPRAPGIEGNGQTILVIDDEPPVLELLTDILTEANFTVKAALNPIEGIELYRLYQQDIAMVILDYSMPGMDGRAAFEALTAINKDVKVLLCSGFSEEETASVFGDFRPADFINKPYRPELLMERIARILAP